MSGRQRGKPNKASAAREARWAAEGKTPLDVMQMAMNHFAKRAELLMEVDPSRMSKKQRKTHENELDSAVTRASAMAEKAAQYVHARITATKLSTDDDRPLEVRVKYV